MPDISRILAAKSPLTLAGLVRGAQPMVLADLARAAAVKQGRAVFVAADDAAMRAIGDAAKIFARAGGGGIPRVGLPAL
jgi:transcription-repair coupling factor (superfamily II helicase)